MRYWIVKGKPGRNDLATNVAVGGRERWISKRPPTALSPGDRAFIWEASPTLRVVGIARVGAVAASPRRDGNHEFVLHYESDYIPSGPAIQDLRQNPVFENASFLKSGPSGTVFPLSRDQGGRLLELLHHPGAHETAESASPSSAPQFLDRAIYVNASSDRLRAANRGEVPSASITEKKAWTTGERLLEEASAAGVLLPLIFAQYAPLTYWGIARSIKVNAASKQTVYRFSHLMPVQARHRHDLVVASTGRPLPDNFIRSYAIVRTPSFLASSGPAAVRDVLQVGVSESDARLSEELVGLEGVAEQRMVLHRRRERGLRAAKIAEALARQGALVCEVPECRFDFAKTYGVLGGGYAQVHHLRPLSDGAGARQTALSDLAIVCANCHAMIHRDGGNRALTGLIVGKKRHESPV